MITYPYLSVIPGDCRFISGEAQERCWKVNVRNTLDLFVEILLYNTSETRMSIRDSSKADVM